MSRTSASARLAMYLAVLMLILVACGGPQTPPPPKGATTLAPWTKVLGDAALAALTNVSDDGTYSFAASDATLAALKVGDVFIAGVSDGTPMGAMRRVESVTPAGAGVVLATSQAKLQDAFKDLDVQLDTSVSALTPQAQADGISFPLNLEASGGGGSVTLSGAVSLAPTFDLNVDFDIASFELDELTMEFGATQTLVANLMGSGQTAFEKSLTLGTIPFAPIVLTLPTPAGAVPLVITPTVIVEARVAGSVAGSFEASVNQEASFTAGVGYANGSFGGFWDGDSDLDFEQPTYAAAAGVRASVGPRLEVLLYGAVGPYASVEGYVQADAHVDSPPLCVRGGITAGLTAKAGVTLVFDEYDTTLLDESVPLATFDSCDPNAPRPAATWARTLGRAGSTGEQAAAVVEASDGSFLVVGDSQLYDGITGFGASLWAIRLDPLGNVMWQRAYSSAYTYGLAEAAVEVPGGFVIATRRGLIGIDTGGNVQWSKEYTTSQFLQITSLAAAPGGGFVLAGMYGDSMSAWAAQVDADGDVVWSRTYSGTDFARVITTSDGGYALVGSRGSNDGDGYLVKLTPGGGIDWQILIDNQYDYHGGEGDETLILKGTEYAYDVAELQGGGYVVVGYSYGAFPNPEEDPTGHFEAWEARVTAGGELVSSTVHRAPSTATNDVAQAVVVKKDGGTVVLGMLANTTADLFESEDVLIIQGGAYSSLGGSGNDTLNTDSGMSGAGTAFATSDGGLIVAATSDTGSSNQRVWLVKLGRTANINFPYKHNPSGTSYANSDAVSFTFNAAPVNAPLAAAVGGPISWESTPAVANWQAP